jgi:hypothetical protein
MALSYLVREPEGDDGGSNIGNKRGSDGEDETFATTMFCAQTTTFNRYASPEIASKRKRVPSVRNTLMFCSGLARRTDFLNTGIFAAKRVSASR